MSIENEVKSDNTIPQETEKKIQNPEKNFSHVVENATETEKTEDPNWRAFREERKKDRQQKEAAERRAAEKEEEVAALKAAMEAAFSKGENQYSRPINNVYEDESEDERIEKKVIAALAAREAQAEQHRQKREQQEYPQRLQSIYADFNQTISSENLDYLEYHYPEVAAPLKRLQDGYDKWSDIYRAVKKFVPNSTTAKKEAEKASNNFNKPKSMSSASVTQSGEAMSSARLTDEKRAENWVRMQKTLHGLT